jgi:hypothetical protein
MIHKIMLSCITKNFYDARSSWMKDVLNPD